MIPKGKQYSIVGARQLVADRDPADTLDRVLAALDELGIKPGDRISVRVDRRNVDYQWDASGSRLWRGEDHEARIDSMFLGAHERARREQRGNDR